MGPCRSLPWRTVIGAYPGSFNPPTMAHLAIAHAVVRQMGARRVDWIVSERALGKEGVERPLFRHRMAVLEAVAAEHAWLGLRVTRHQLIADIAEGYDVVVLGADKWAQVADSTWYGGSVAERDAALARLPALAVVPRPPYPVPAHATRLDGLEIEHISSTGVREQGRIDWMAPAAMAFAARTGAWIDPARYEAWLTSDTAPT